MCFSLLDILIMHLFSSSGQSSFSAHLFLVDSSMGHGAKRAFLYTVFSEVDIINCDRFLLTKGRSKK